jgi:hypothetical protein
MAQLQNLTNEQIISFLQEDRDILIPFYTTREQIDQIMGMQLTSDEWLRMCENIQDVFAPHLQDNLFNELSYLTEQDEFLLDETFLNTNRPKTIYQEIVEQDEENSVNLTLSAMQLKVIYNILIDTPFDSAHTIAGETLKVLKENNFDRQSQGLPF